MDVLTPKKFVFGINFNSHLASQLRLFCFHLSSAGFRYILHVSLVNFSHVSFTCSLTICIPILFLISFTVQFKMNVNMLNIPADSRPTGSHSRGVELRTIAGWQGSLVFKPSVRNSADNPDTLPTLLGKRKQSLIWCTDLVQRLVTDFQHLLSWTSVSVRRT